MSKQNKMYTETIDGWCIEDPAGIIEQQAQHNTKVLTRLGILDANGELTDKSLIIEDLLLSELLPCPCCGSEPKTIQWRDTERPNATWIECPTCGIMTDSFHDPHPIEAEQRARLIWNTRIGEKEIIDQLTAANEKLRLLGAAFGRKRL